MTELTEQVLLAPHRRFDALASAASRKLVAGLTADAWGVSLVSLRAELLHHMRVEEALVLPRFRELIVEPPPGTAAELVERDHDLIRNHIVELAADDSTSLEVLRRLRALTRVLEHHDEREARGYVALLAPRVSPEEVAEWRDALAAAATPAPPARPPLLAESSAIADVQRRLMSGRVVTPELFRDLEGSDLHPGHRRRVASWVAAVRLGAESTDLTERLAAFDATESIRRLTGRPMASADGSGTAAGAGGGPPPRR